MTTKITITDKFGTHELEAESDCICIVDNGKGNISIIEDYDDEDDIYNCDNCGRCIGRSYCVLEEDDYEEEDFYWWQ